MTQLRPRRALPAALLAAASLVPLSAAPETPREMWFGMYVGDMKMGHLTIRAESVRFRGSDALKTSSSARTEMVLLGTRMSQDIGTTAYCDLKGRPVYEEFRVSSGGKTTEVFAEVGKDSIECRMVTAAGATQKTIPVPTGTVLVGDSYTPTLQDRPVVGAKHERMAFNPLTLALEELTIEVLREETIEHEGKRVSAVVVRTVSPTADMTAWHSPDGADIYRIEAPMGIVMRREPKEKAAGAPSGGYQPPGDFAVVTSVRPDVTLPPDRPLASLKIRLSGIPDASFAITDERQKIVAQAAGPPRTVTYQITARAPSPAAAATLPVKAPAFKTWLQPDPYANSDDPAIVREARRMVGGEKNIVKAAEKIRLGVRALMTSDSSMGVLRPASDVLKNPSGVCRDYAILFTALARAAGIPARPVGGFTLSRGSFYYHAWAEVWTGREWMAVDATLPASTADAGHIKLTQGDATRMYAIAKVAGQLKAEILEFR